MSERIIPIDQHVSTGKLRLATQVLNNKKHPAKLAVIWREIERREQGWKRAA